MSFLKFSTYLSVTHSHYVYICRCIYINFFIQPSNSISTPPVSDSYYSSSILSMSASSYLSLMRYFYQHFYNYPYMTISPSLTLFINLILSQYLCQFLPVYLSQAAHYYLSIYLSIYLKVGQILYFKFCLIDT